MIGIIFSQFNLSFNKLTEESIYCLLREMRFSVGEKVEVLVDYARFHVGVIAAASDDLRVYQVILAGGSPCMVFHDNDSQIRAPTIERSFFYECPHWRAVSRPPAKGSTERCAKCISSSSGAY